MERNKLIEQIVVSTMIIILIFAILYAFDSQYITLSAYPGQAVFMVIGVIFVSNMLARGLIFLKNAVIAYM